MSSIDVSNETELNDTIDDNIHSIINITNSFTVFSNLSTITKPLIINGNNFTITGNTRFFLLFRLDGVQDDITFNDLKINNTGKAFYIQNCNNIYFNNVEITNSGPLNNNLIPNSINGGAIYFDSIYLNQWNHVFYLIIWLLVVEDDLFI